MADPADSNSCYATLSIDDVEVFSNRNYACEVLETELITIYVGGGTNAAEDNYASLTIGGIEWLGDEEITAAPAEVADTTAPPVETMNNII